MRQVLYIEADEEMISVIGRLRRSTASENVIVAPYRSLILQSIVNLRLLSHDARKNGKEIIVVTQDEQSRSLCEKAGIRTQAALDDQDAHEVVSNNRYAIPQEFPSPPSFQQNASMPQQGEFPRQPADQRQSFEQEIDTSSLQLPHSDSIGSTDFFGTVDIAQPQAYRDVPPPSPHFPIPQQPRLQQSQQAVKPTYGDIKRLAVRDQNPKKLTSLNSQRFEEEKILNQQKSFTPPSLRGAQATPPVFAPAPVSLADSPAARMLPPRPEEQNPFQFLTHDKQGSPARPIPTMPIRMSEKNESKESGTVVSGGKKIRAFFIFFSFVSILSVASVGAYLLLPKADVRVKLKVATQKSDFEFEGSSDISGYSAESKTIPVRMIEKDQDFSVSFDATGKASLADQKARGSVIIYNEYNADPQVLVASTRLLSQDGKVFRLLSGVTVPGMATANGKTEPGAIEAAVVADQSGPEYNVAPTSFTIPGFESSAKQNKFYAKSSAAMNGGGSSGSDVAAVSDQDVAMAKKSTEARIKDFAINVVNESLNAGEKVLDEAIDASIVSSNASPQSGAVTDSFDYHVKVRVRAFVFSEDDLKKMISTLFAQQNATKGLNLSLNAIDLQYGEPTADFAAGTLRIKVYAVGHSESSFDKSKLKADLLGQDENAINGLLQKYEQIDTISIALWPELISKKIPTREDRVTVSVDSANADEKR